MDLIFSFKSLLLVARTGFTGERRGRNHPWSPPKKASGLHCAAL